MKIENTVNTLIIYPATPSHSNCPYNICSKSFKMFHSVLWLDVLSIDSGRRLTAFGCQNGCVGLALVDQTGPGKTECLHLGYIYSIYSSLSVLFAS